MNRLLNWLWKQGIVSTFLAGLFTVLPVVITIAIISWVAGKLHAVFASDTFIGQTLIRLGGTVSPESGGMLVGGVLVLVGVWCLGLLVKWTARHRLEDVFHAAVNRVPLVGAIYKPVSQVVGMLKRDDSSEMGAMNVVFCAFGAEQGGGFLALLASPHHFRFADQDCYVIYIPTSPVPMSGGIVFVPTSAVHRVDMSVDDLMQIYFSLGVMASQVVPERYRPSGGPPSAS